MTTTADLKCSSLQAGYQGQSHKVTATDAQSPGMPRVLLGWMTPILENPEADTQLIRGIERSPRYVDARIEHVQNRATGDLPPQ